jgi:hypothetical protein
LQNSENISNKQIQLDEDMQALIKQIKELGGEDFKLENQCQFMNLDPKEQNEIQNAFNNMQQSERLVNPSKDSSLFGGSMSSGAGFSNFELNQIPGKLQSSENMCLINDRGILMRNRLEDVIEERKGNQLSQSSGQEL